MLDVNFVYQICVDYELCALKRIFLRSCSAQKIFLLLQEKRLSNRLKSQPYYCLKYVIFYDQVFFQQMNMKLHRF